MSKDDESEGGWNPEEERVPEELQKEYLKLVKHMNEQAEDAKRKQAEEKKMRAEQAAKGATAAPGELASLSGFLVQATRRPSHKDIVSMCKRCWADVEATVPNAPESVKATMFAHLLSNAVNHEVQDDGVGYA